MTKKLYMTGCSNYATHNQAQRMFRHVQSAAALELRQDGTASIAWLDPEPVQPGQAPYVGTQPTCNTRAEDLRR